MNYANFGDNQYVNAALLNNMVSATQGSLSLLGSSLHTPGLVQGLTVGFSVTGLFLGVTAPSPFAVLFGSGTLAQANGTTNGTASSSYSVNFTSLVPGTGSVTAYLLASAAVVGLNPVIVVGPPVGHPDYNPSFAPYLLYSQMADTVALAASTTPPDNVTTFELCRFTLVAGQSVITGINTNFQQRAGAVLSQNGEVVQADLQPTGISAGSYGTPTLSLGADGRVYSVLAGGFTMVAYGSTGTFTFPTPTNVTKVRVRIWAGGGGGGSSFGTDSGGSGGGGGEYREGWFTVVPSTGYTVVVGAAGAGGTGTNNGGTGGNSSFGSFMFCVGGSGGIAGVNTVQGAVGTGGSGGSGGALVVIGLNGGAAAFLGGTLVMGGQGGAAFGNVGGYSPIQDMTAVGNIGMPYGAAGSGGIWGAGGGNGSPGAVIIEYVG